MQGKVLKDSETVTTGSPSLHCIVELKSLPDIKGKQAGCLPLLHHVLPTYIQQAI
jgi:hypothetical protein